MAEFLVHQRVPVTCISLIVVRHETIPVAVRPWWYFENV